MTNNAKNKARAKDVQMSRTPRPCAACPFFSAEKFVPPDASKPSPYTQPELF